MSNLLLIMSIVLNILLSIHIFRLKKYIENIFSKLEINSIDMRKQYQTINQDLSFISNNMDRHFDSMAGKIHMLSSVLRTGNKRNK